MLFVFVSYLMITTIHYIALYAYQFLLSILVWKCGFYNVELTSQKSNKGMLSARFFFAGNDAHKI